MRSRAPQQRNVYAIVVRAAMVEHYYGASAWTQHAMNPLYRLRGLGRVMQNAVRVDQIKTLVGEVEVFSVCCLKLAGKIEQLKTFARQLNSRVGRIDSGVISARCGKLRAVGSESTTDFQDFQTTRTREVCGNGNVPLLRVAMRFDQLVEMARARRRVGKLHAAGIRLPKSAHAFLEIVIWISHRKTKG